MRGLGGVLADPEQDTVGLHGSPCFAFATDSLLQGCSLESGLPAQKLLLC